MVENENLSENGENDDFQKGGRNSDLEHMPGFSKFPQGKQYDVNKANILKNNMKSSPSKTHFSVSNFISLRKAIRKLKAGCKYQIKSPSTDWAETK